MKNSVKAILAVASAGLVVAGGSAFTASNTIPATVAGLGAGNVTGGTASSVVHTFTADGETILSTAITFTAPADLSAVVVKAGLGAVGVDPTITCTEAGAVATCTWGNGTTTGVGTTVADSLTVLVTTG